MVKGFTAVCNSFLGMDERAGCATKPDALSELINFRVADDGSLKMRGGFTTVQEQITQVKATALWSGELDGEKRSFSAYGNAIYCYGDGEPTCIGLVLGEVASFVKFGKKLYTLGTEVIYEVTPQAVTQAIPYAPLIASGLSPEGAGTTVEQPNILTPRRRARYCPDGSATEFHLPEPRVTSIEKILLNGTLVSASKYSFNSNRNSVSFDIAPAEGIDTLEIHYYSSTRTRMTDISLCRYATVFENRLFLYGNSENPDKLYHSELADGLPCCTYFTDVSYHCFDKEITGLIPCYNRLLIFFESSACFTYAELHNDTLGNTYTSFPVFELNSTKGSKYCGVGCLMLNTPVTLCDDGLNRWVSTYIADERSAEAFSHRMHRFFSSLARSNVLPAMLNRKSASELWIACGGGIAIYNYKLNCFYTYGLYDVILLCEDGNGVLIARKNGTVMRYDDTSLTDNGLPIYGTVKLPYCSFGTPFSLKSMKAISVEVSGSAAFEAYAFLERGDSSDFHEVHLSLPTATGAVTRRIQLRAPLKRFYSARLTIETSSSAACIRSIGFEGGYCSGGIRLC